VLDQDLGKAKEVKQLENVGDAKQKYYVEIN